MTLLSEPALANKTYSRAKTCYQNQYVETYHPGTREKPGYVSSREERVERPCPKTQHFQPQTQGGASRPQPFSSSTDNVRRTKGYGDSRSRGRQFLFGRNPRWRRSRWSLGRRACQKGQLELVDSGRGCWRCPCWMSGRWRLSLYRVHAKCWLEKPAVAVQTNAQQIHPDVTNSDHH